jgi:S1-C subfamily serine protease
VSPDDEFRTEPTTGQDPSESTPPPGAFGSPSTWSSGPSAPDDANGTFDRPPSRPPSRRVTAIVAIIALVLMSAGIGAALATALRHESRSFTTAIPDIIESGPDDSDVSLPPGFDVDAIAARVTPAVVNIFTTLGDGDGETAGTGIVITPDGKVLTNNHVIEDSSEIRVQVGGEGSMLDATTIGYDAEDDIALLQIEDVSGLETAVLGDPSDVEPGDPILAIGNAQGRGGEPEVVAGEVAALDQSVTAGDGSGDAETLHGMIQVEAAIRSGDSGGPLVNADGEVIGVNTAASVGRFQMQSTPRVAFAIPIDTAMAVVELIDAGDERDGVHIGPRGLLGVQVERAPDGVPFGDDEAAEGAVVVEVRSDSPADDAGIENGDVIVAIDGEGIDTGRELVDSLADSHPRDRVTVTWIDDSGNERSATVRLASGPPA